MNELVGSGSLSSYIGEVLQHLGFDNLVFPVDIDGFGSNDSFCVIFFFGGVSVCMV